MAYTINFNVQDITGKKFSFDDVRKLLDFSTDEYRFWVEKQQALTDMGRASAYIGFIKTFGQIKSLIEGWIPQLDTWDQNTLDSNVNQKIPIWTKGLNSRLIWSGHPFIEAWMDAYKLSDGAGNSFFEFHVQKNSNNTANYESLRGYYLAIDYQLQQLPDIKTRLVTEEISFDQLRESLEKRRDKFLDEIYQSQSEIKEWVNHTKSDFSEWKDSVDKSHAEELGVQKNTYENQISNQAKTFESCMAEWKQRKDELEKTYADKLKLEKPAEYWKNRAKELHQQAMWWVCFLVLSLTVGVVTFLWLFYGWVIHEKLPFSMLSLQGAIIFATAISAYVFLIKTFSKLAFSSFHLQRDAEEREQLAYLYLALSKEGKVDENSLAIVLQALFTRSESGLLQKESGPTMPTIGEVVTTAARAHR